MIRSAIFINCILWNQQWAEVRFIKIYMHARVMWTKLSKCKIKYIILYIYNILQVLLDDIILLLSKYLRKFYDIYKNSLYPDWKIDTELLSWISLSNWINSFLQNKRWSRNFLSLAHWLMIASFSLTQKLTWIW